MKKINPFSIIINMTFICIFILPATMKIGQYSIPLSKLVFTLVSTLLYCIYAFKIRLKDIIFLFFLFITICVQQSIDALGLTSIGVALKFFNNTNIIQIREYILKSKIIWFSLFFTFIYSILYFGDGRYLHTAVQEINLSAASWFLLCCIFYVKNKKIGLFLLFLGVLTLSRAYLISIICFFIFKNKHVSKYYSSRVIKFTNFSNIMIISGIILFLLGIWFQNQYLLGNIDPYNISLARMFNMVDISNYLRFVTNVILLIIFVRHPYDALFGIVETKYLLYKQEICNIYHFVYSSSPPHNFLFAYLKIYGVMTFFIFYFINSILKKIINRDNYGIYLCIMIYVVFLSVGFNSYWLFLSVFVLVCFQEKNKKGSERIG